MSTCSICGWEFEGCEHDASPYDGCCCSECHVLVVLPARLAEQQSPPPVPEDQTK